VQLAAGFAQALLGIGSTKEQTKNPDTKHVQEQRQPSLRTMMHSNCQ
jgi:hypothetical protein